MTLIAQQARALPWRRRSTRKLAAISPALHGIQDDGRVRQIDGRQRAVRRRSSLSSSARILSTHTSAPSFNSGCSSTFQIGAGLSSSLSSRRRLPSSHAACFRKLLRPRLPTRWSIAATRSPGSTTCVLILGIFLFRIDTRRPRRRPIVELPVLLHRPQQHGPDLVAGMDPPQIVPVIGGRVLDWQGPRRKVQAGGPRQCSQLVHALLHTLRNANEKEPFQSGFGRLDRKSTRLNSSHLGISYAV